MWSITTKFIACISSEYAARWCILLPEVRRPHLGPFLVYIAATPYSTVNVPQAINPLISLFYTLDSYFSWASSNYARIWLPIR